MDLLLGWTNSRCSHPSSHSFSSPFEVLQVKKPMSWRMKVVSWRWGNVDSIALTTDWLLFMYIVCVCVCWVVDSSLQVLVRKTVLNPLAVSLYGEKEVPPTCQHYAVFSPHSMKVPSESIRLRVFPPKQNLREHISGAEDETMVPLLLPCVRFTTFFDSLTKGVWWGYYK